MYLLYVGGLKSSYEDILSVVSDFLTNEIQPLQYRWKMCVDHIGTMLKTKLYLVTFHESILVRR